MGKEKTKKFKWRGMVTLLLVMLVLVDALSGIVLYFTPSGSIARWTGWTFLGLDKEGWSAVHIIFSILLLLILIGHIYFNWRVLTHFIWNKMRQVINLKREFATALVVTIVFLIGTLLYVEPIGSIVDFRETLKHPTENGLVQGQGNGYGRRAADHRNVDTANIGNAHMNSQVKVSQSTDQYAGRGWGLGKRAYARQADGIPAVKITELKGRDFARLGKPESHTGTLVRLGNEWGLKVGETVYEVHMGPEEYRISKGFVLTAGAKAHVMGFVYNSDLAVTTMKTEGKSITLRDESGRPAWSGTGFSRGGGQQGFPGGGRGE